MLYAIHKVVIMRFDSLRKQRQPRLMIIPMIDVILFLLVFFIMSTLHMIDQKTLPVKLPQAAAAADAATRIPVTVMADGSIQLFEKNISLSELPIGLKAAAASHPGSAVALRADKTVAYGKVVEVLGKIQAAGISNIAVAVESGGAK